MTITQGEQLSVDGVDVVVEGRGARTLLMLHGWPDTLHLWDETVLALQDDFRCCRFTLPGFAPGAERCRPTLAQVNDLLLHVVDRVGPGGKVTLVLHDWGAIFGYQFAMRHPDRVERIVGVDIGDVESMPRTLRRREMAGVAGYQLWLALAFRMGRLGDRMTRAMARALRAPADPSTISARMNWPYDLTWFGGRESLRLQSVPFRPHCPMLFVYGRRKPFMFHSRAWAEALAGQPGSRVEAFDTGHWVMTKDPAGFHRVLRDWLVS
jgi:cis-3-alkyl-4-acyloxetan-2-one decarboxylase